MSGFSDWVRDDIDESLVVQDDRISWQKADRTAVRSISLEKTVMGDFLHSFTVSIEEAYIEDGLNRGLLRLWEVRNDWQNRTWIYARKTGEGWSIHYEHRYQKEDLWGFHDENVLELGHRYIVELQRIGKIYSLRVFDEHGSKVADSGPIKGVDQIYEWVWLASTIKARRNNGNYSSGYIEELVIS